MSRDHTVLKAATNQQQLLNQELGHRLKNLLTLVQSISSHTLRQAPDTETASAALSSRLSALGHATDVLTATEWTKAYLADVVDAALTSAGGLHDRIDVSGDPIEIPAQQALALTLAIHELATNATKHGALSNETGRVRLLWSLSDASERRLSLILEETGGPAVTPPTKKGFGSRLIERSLSAYFSGHTTVDYLPTGLVFRLDAPLMSPSVEGKA